MKLIDPETNKEYEFEEQVNHYNKDEWVSGTLKPVDSWPKEGDEYWFINADGDVGHIKQNRYGLDENDKFLGVYRTKQEAEYAADRIRSLQKITRVYARLEPVAQTAEIVFTLPKKYLKAWRELQDE